MKYLDIFETKFNFYSDKKKIYYTTLGGILSIITFCLCLFTFFFFVKDDIQRISPDKLFISNILEKEYETILIDKKLFIPWRIINKNNELEDNKRGIYGGAIGYVDLSGNIDTCISIRIAFARNNKVFIRSGAGIVADSIPDNEFDECLNKAAAVIDALKIANGGIE